MDNYKSNVFKLKGFVFQRKSKLSDKKIIDLFKQKSKKIFV